MTAAVAMLLYALAAADELPPDDAQFADVAECPRPADSDNVYAKCIEAEAALAMPRWSKEREPWNAASAAKVDALVESNATAIAVFREAARCGHWCCSPVHENRFPCECLPPLHALSRLTILLRIRGMRCADRGEIDEATAFVRDLLAISRTIRRDSELIVTWLMADAPASYGAVDVALRIAKSGKATDAQLAALADAIRDGRGESAAASLKRAIRREAKAAFSPDALRENLRTPPVPLAEFSRFAALCPAYAFKPNQTSRIYLDAVREASALLDAEWYDAGKWSEYAAGHDWRFGFGVRDLLRPNAVGRCFLAFSGASDFGAVAAKALEAEFRTTAVAAAVAVARYERRHGEPPDALEQLVPEFLDAVPVDPFDHGRPVKYDKEEGVIELR